MAGRFLRCLSSTSIFSVWFPGSSAVRGLGLDEAQCKYRPSVALACEPGRLNHSASR